MCWEYVTIRTRPFQPWATRLFSHFFGVPGIRADRTFRVPEGKQLRSAAVSKSLTRGSTCGKINYAMRSREKGMRRMNGQIPETFKKKPFRNWKLSGKAFYERSGRTEISHEKAPAATLDATEVERRIKYGY